MDINYTYVSYPMNGMICREIYSEDQNNYTGNITCEGYQFLGGSNILPITIPIFGYFSPMLVLFTIITNLLICVVLLKKNMRTPTNTMLVAMAISDMLTGVFPIPSFIYFYTFGHYVEWVPYNLCLVYYILTDYLPTIFHTASIWLTMALAVQRYIYICHSIKARQLCTINNVLKGVAFVYIISTLSHATRFFDTIYTASLIPSMVDPNETVIGCSSRFSPYVHSIGIDIYFNIYIWYRVVLIHLVPCTSLVLLNSILVYTMHKAQARRKQLLQQNRKSECKKLKEANTTTMMLVAVVFVFLLVELPLGGSFIIIVIQNTMKMKILEDTTLNYVQTLINLFILLSYPINFFIYCGMSRQFRETFKRLFVSGGTPLDREHTNYISLATENGNNKNELPKSEDTHL